MATSYTYATLTSDLTSFLEDDGTDFAAQVDDFIALAEDRVLRDLDLTIFDTTSEETLSADAALLTKPTGALFTRAVFVKDSGDNWDFVAPRSHEFLIDYYPSSSASGTANVQAKYWCDYSPTQLRFAPVSDTQQTVRCTCMIKPTQLSSGNTTTWLSTNVGDLLLYACLIVSSQYNVSDERLPMWEENYARLLAAARVQFQHLRAPTYSPVVAAPQKVVK